MHVNRRASGVNHNITALNETTFFKNIDLVFDNIVKTFFFIVIKALTPQLRLSWLTSVFVL